MEDSIISRIPLFEGLSPDEQEELRAMMTQTTLRRGETLFNEATQATASTFSSPGR